MESVTEIFMQSHIDKLPWGSHRILMAQGLFTEKTYGDIYSCIVHYLVFDVQAVAM